MRIHHNEGDSFKVHFTCSNVIFASISVRPHIDRESMRTITIKVGQNFEFDVPVQGEPPPEKVWSFDDKPLSASAHIKVYQLILSSQIL